LKDMELLLEEEVMQFSPAYVVVAVFTGNDFRDTYLGIGKDNIVDGVAVLDEENIRNIRVLIPPQHLVEDVTVVKPCARESSVLRLFDSRSSAFRLLAPLVGMENLCIDFAVNRKFTRYTYWSQYPYPEVALRAKDDVLETLSRMDAFLEARGARLALVALPMSEQVHARRPDGPDYDIALPQLYLQSFARERDIPYIDLLPILRSHVERTNERVFVRSDPHLNNRGHEIVGGSLAEWFRCCVRNPRRRPPSVAHPTRPETS